MPCSNSSRKDAGDIQVFLSCAVVMIDIRKKCSRLVNVLEVIRIELVGMIAPRVGVMKENKVQKSFCSFEFKKKGFYPDCYRRSLWR